MNVRDFQIDDIYDPESLVEDGPLDFDIRGIQRSDTVDPVLYARLLRGVVIAKAIELKYGNREYRRFLTEFTREEPDTINIEDHFELLPGDALEDFAMHIADKIGIDDEDDITLNAIEKRVRKLAREVQA